MSLRDHLNRIAMKAAQEAVIGYTPNIQQGTSSQANSVIGATVTAVNFDGTVNVQTVTGKTINNLMVVTDNSIQVGTTGNIYGNSMFYA